jgi:glutamyl-tRNA reductase
VSSTVFALGISHKTAPVAVRERLAMSNAQAGEFALELVDLPEIEEAVAISTCNRTEVYVVTADPLRAETALLGRLAERSRMRPTELSRHVASPRNCDAARHLFRVVSGLESMVVGEAEVQGQVRRAYELSLGTGTAGPLLNRLFGAALATGKRVRTETRLGRNHTSVSTVAVQLAREAVGDLAQRRVVIIGAGETAELTAQALHDAGATSVFVANRRAARARALAERLGGAVGSLEDLPEQLKRADVVVTSTSSPHALLAADDLEPVMEERAARPLVLIDIAVPRDVDPACGDLPGVVRYDVDDLQAVVDRNMSVREGERDRAEAVVERELQRFAHWLSQLEVTPTVAALRAHGQDIVEQVLAENTARWETASERDVARAEAIARAVMQRLLHEPTIRLKAAEGGHGRLQVVRDLFGLNDPPPVHDAAGPALDGPPAEVRELRRRRR